MKIQQVTIENFMRIKYAEIRPDRHLYIIGGNNGQGKTSAIKAIVAALGGKTFHPPKPVRNGTDRATVKIKTDEFDIEAFMTADNYGLKVSQGEAVYPAGQTVLNRFHSRLNFDPLNFLRIDDSKRIAILKKLSGIGETIDNLQQKRQAEYDQRTIVNRDKERAAGEVSRLKAIVGDNPPQRIMVAEITKALEQKLWQIEEQAANTRELEISTKRLAEMDEKIQELEERLAKCREAREEQHAHVASLETIVADHQPIDPEPEREALAQADAINQQADIHERMIATEIELKAHTDKSNQHTKEIEAIDARIATALANATLPVPGLSWKDDVLFLNEIPFEQASQAEQLRAAFLVAFSEAPGLKCFLSTDGSLLDNNALAILEETAKQHGVTVLLERVGQDQHTAIVFEDGLIVGQESPHAPEDILSDLAEPATQETATEKPAAAKTGKRSKETKP